MIFFVGTFPPPTHGMSVVNQAVCQKLRLAGFKVVELNIAHATLKSDLLSRSWRWERIFRAWGSLLKSGMPGDQLYLSISGGWGQLYDLVTLLIARRKGMRCVIHHHNFAYLDKFRGLTRVVLKAAGRDSVNVALCSHMAQRLQTGYAVRRTTVLSNIAFLPDVTGELGTKELRTVGFLSNLTREKGADTLLALAWAIKEKGLPFRVIVAGPCHDLELCQKLREAHSKGALEWRGEVSGQDKAAFWHDADVFVFPSCSEAEPLVVFEAMMSGTPLISYARGCIPEQLGHAGVLVPPTGDFVHTALHALQQWSADPAEYDSCCRQTIEQYQGLKDLSGQQWQSLLAILSENAADRLIVH